MRRIRLTYRLRTLLGLMATVTIATAVPSWWFHSLHRQEQAIDAIAQKGGYVWWDRAESCFDVEFGMPKREGCGQIILLSGGQGNPTTFDDGDLSVLNDLWRLRRVSFANTHVSSQAIEQFRESHRSVEVSD